MREKNGRLSDTAALTRKGLDGSMSHSISSRKIDNGYLICQTTSNPTTGEFKCTEMYSPGEPKITPGTVAKGLPADDGPGLGDTMKYLRDGE